MKYLIDHYGYLSGGSLAVLTVFGRYLVFASLTYLFFDILFKKLFFNRKIQQKYPKSSRIFREIRHSAYTSVIFALMGLGVYLMKEQGFTLIYDDVEAKSRAYFVLSLVMLIVLHDTFFYWAHRLMHHPRLFVLMHKEHHLSHNPTPFTALSFHPLEAIIEVAIIPIAVLIMPLHPAVILLFVTWSLLWNIVGHLGYEIFPKDFVRHPIWRWFNTSTHHNLHHSKTKCNYGLYFNFWDTVMKTNHVRYREIFDEIKERPGVVAEKSKLEV